MDPISIAAALKPFVGLGVSAWNVRSKPGAESDVDLIQKLIDAGISVRGLRRSDGRLTAAHLALVVRAFGEAFSRYWYADKRLAPGVGLFERLTQDAFGRARMDRIEACLKLAAVRLVCVFRPS